MRSDTVLQAARVCAHFGGVTALDDVDLTLAGGEVRGLIGPNGAGKTTLFDVLTGVQPATSGSVFLDGRDVTRRSPTWRARHGIRRTFQRQQTFGSLSVEENLLVPIEWRGGGGGLLADLVRSRSRSRLERQRRERAEAVIELCGLGAVRHEAAGRLPIGRARMVEVARAMIDRPRVILLDEPTSGLSGSETAALGRLIQLVRDVEGCAVLLVEHDVGFVMDQSDLVTVLHLGRVIAEGPPDEIRSDRGVSEAYLG